MDTGLIFDLGCNNGDDTDFYLRKGFSVVAIDADESLCNHVSNRFAPQIAARKLEVLYGAVGHKSGEIATFYICDDRTDWSTCDPYFVAQSEQTGVRYRKIEVPTLNVADVMKTRGTPYYLKIDIEGADTIPLETLIGRREIPSYVSVEIAQHDFSEGLKQIRLLRRLGYTKFNFFNQGMRGKVRAPRPALEGDYATFNPSAVTTGLFGRELGGVWLDQSAAEKRFAGIHRRYHLFRDNKLYSPDGQFGGTLLSKIHNRFRRHVLGDPVAWYDLHAKLE